MFPLKILGCKSDKRIMLLLLRWCSPKYRSLDRYSLVSPIGDLGRVTSLVRTKFFHFVSKILLNFGLAFSGKSATSWLRAREHPI